MQPGEIFLAQFPFGDVAGMKLRPVLLLTGQVGPIPEVLVACISSEMPAQLLTSDLVIDPSKPEFRPTHLKMISTLRLHKLATVHCSSLSRRLGAIAPDASTAVADN
jgi:mRNA interferase MazF